jgi:hypothetical protein
VTTVSRPLLLLLAIPIVLSAPASAFAEDIPGGAVDRFGDLETDLFEPSPVYGVWEIFAIGPYSFPFLDMIEPNTVPNIADDRGPLLSTELNFFLFRIPYFGRFGLGGRVGWTRHSGMALPVDVDREADPEDLEGQGEPTAMTLFPLTPLAVLRIDVLARELGIPILFALKLGMDIIPWRISRGGVTDEKGVEYGMRWGAQVALELDFLEPRAARRLDDEWGINHTFIFVEIFGSTAQDLGANFAWTAGLGIVF